jgi:hypothetical protein
MKLREKGIRADAQRLAGWKRTLAEREQARESEITKAASEKMKYINPVDFFSKLRRFSRRRQFSLLMAAILSQPALTHCAPAGRSHGLTPVSSAPSASALVSPLAQKSRGPDYDVVILYGDGSAGYSIMEFDTFVRHKLPVGAIIGNDACWTQIYRDQIEFLKDDVACMLNYSHYEEISKTFGGAGKTISKPAQIKAGLTALKKSLAKKQPFILNVLIGRSEFRKDPYRCRGNMTINPDPDKIHKPWLKHYDRHVPPSLAYPKETLPELFAASCAENAHRIALKFLGKSLSYAQVEASANAFAAYFAEQGVKKGDRVFLMLPNSPHFVIVYYAILKCGAVAVPASPLDTPTEAEYKFRNSGAKLVVFLDLLYDKVSALLQQNADIPAVAADVSEYLPFPKNMLFRLKKKSLGKPLPDFTRANLCTFGGVLREYRHRSAEPVQIAGSDTAVMIYTGGTTGVSKGVVLSHHAMVVNMTQARTWGDLSKNDIGLCVLPFFHGFGISIGLNLSLSSGGKMVLMPRWDEAQAIRHFEKDGITVFCGCTDDVQRDAEP